MVATKQPSVSRRRLLLASAALPLLPWLPGCRASLPALRVSSSSAAARDLLARSADAHGSAPFGTLDDVNVSYAGHWHPIVGRLQPTLVDAGFRGGSQERLLVKTGILAQAHTGPSGRKEVVRRIDARGTGDVVVWFNNDLVHDERRDAAALVADGYNLFLLGPMLLDRYQQQGRSLIMEIAAAETVTQSRDSYECDVLRIQMQPGIGFSDTDDLAVFLDRDSHLMRRIRFTLNGLVSTRGALAEVDTTHHTQLFGVQWPTRFHEKLLRPVPLQVHDWRLTGIDVDRHLTLAEVSGAELQGQAARAASPLPPG